MIISSKSGEHCTIEHRTIEQNYSLDPIDPMAWLLIKQQTGQGRASIKYKLGPTCLIQTSSGQPSHQATPSIV